MSLHEYARKRRFGQTPEPAGEAGAGRRGHRPIFVVQLHHARARHYDFRLEMDGTLKSWAVPKGPSLRPGEKRLAVEVEDHPLSYASFEGDIPEGHYGAGHVDLFDHGVWSADGDPLAALAAGKIDFSLHGEKLNGAWKLVRTAKPARQPQWLLIKRQDEHARDGEADDLISAPKKARKKTAGRTARKKTPSVRKKAAKRARRQDWRARALALEGARPQREKKPPPLQLATLRAEPPRGDDWLHELKWDGYRMLARVEHGKARLRSRKNLDWTADYPEIVSALEALGISDADFDGELIALDAQGRDSFSALQRTIEGSANAVLRYTLFDLPALEGVDLTETRLIERKALLEALLDGADPVLAYSKHIVGHGAEVFEASGRQGMEGIISKHVDARYYDGRSTTWLKVKHAQSDEFVVVGYTAPRRSRTGFGSLLLATREGGALKYVGRVGSGFDDATLRSLTAALRKLERKSPTVELPPHIPLSLRTVTWVEPKLIVEIAFRGWAKEGLLRQGSFQRLREDKAMKDIGGDTQPRISSPDKRVYPDSGITKQQVADYYQAIAPRLLPEIARRPLSLLRCPDGIKSQCFFQKHHAGTLGSQVRAVPIREKDGGTDDYLYVDSVGGLLDLVQMNTLELHPWGSRIDDLEHPDTLVFDLDPGPGVKWSAVIAAAREVRARLEEIGLQSFLRVSGGKGLHVVLPIRPGPGWDEAKAFCEAFADAMATQAPQRYVATASKAKRKGVIFIDWLRNGRGATSVASWSLRARAGAPVAVPLRWDELGRTKSGADFDMKKALARSARLRKPVWEGWGKAIRQKLVRLG
ncbi:ATP-dependent DNA ligase LigD phosphoesterase module/ATP-dependent DNA ligase LigD polymerase module [Luteimonas cucumeris]|uniref:DNA ligase (ATP) n=1 Tax=Luteimonas cucumeris TaxID=985012 RepID=A0A562LA47_9GAMM|nr:DNA ligase D [Luteimonas cucumeris]TWI04539.1 ATP-dependent DNA ligase LigD phosphoesterase module/ATP-dependent DNA ligase LigD polymerase module [Luteimonas cucumeris]